MGSQIMFFASEVSVVCELNPYRNLHDTFLEVWKRTDPSQIARVEEKIKCELQSRDEMVEKLIRTIDVDGNISKLVKSASLATTIEEVQFIKSSIPTSLPFGESVSEMVSKIDSFDMQKDIIKAVESQMNRSFGSQQESSAILKYEETEHSNVGSRNDKFHKRTIAHVDGCDIIVGGRVDGMKEDGTVIEVKNRMRRFFEPLPKYDVAQLQTYMYILDSSKGELVEQLKGAQTEIKNTPIDRDLDMWNDLLKPKIVRFGTAVHQFMHNSELQYKFVLGNESERKELVYNLLYYGLH